MMWEAGGSTASSSGAGGGGGGDGRRKPSYRERENNKRRERRRRAFATKIYSGLRALGNFNLPKNCDNNEVLKALCSQAGWIVEPDGTTYRKGCIKPSPMEMGGGFNWSNNVNITPTSSTNQSPPSSSYFPSSYQPSPLSSSCTSPTNHRNSNPFAFLFNNSSLPPLRISSSAPVTPPLSSPRSFPMQTFTLDNISNIPFFASAPSSPTRAPPQRFTLEDTIPECDHESDTSTIHSSQWSMNFQAYANAAAAPNVNMVPTSPTFNLVKPMTQCVLSNDVAMLDNGKGKDQFDFENMAVVKPWEGERIHEDVGLMDDDLQLTLGSGSGS